MSVKDRDTKDLLVYIIRRDSQCAECGIELLHGSFLYLEKGRPLCLSCADLDHLEFLGSGDRALTLRAKKYSKVHAIVLQWSRARKRYERQGILADSEAIEQAMKECLSDVELREERRKREALRRADLDIAYITEFASHIRQLLPHCPEKDVSRIAEHACEKCSGRIGRTAMAKQFDSETILLAVRAYIRHAYTGYDELLMRRYERSIARNMVQDKVDKVLKKWQK